MRMRGFADFRHRSLERLAEHDFRNDIGGAVSDNLASDYFAVLLGRDDLHEARGLAHRNRLAHRTKWNLADLHLDTARLRLRLAQSDRRNFGLAINASRNREQVEAGLAHARHYFHRRDSLGARLMRQQRRPNHVANRVDTRHARLERVVHLDKTPAIQLDAKLLESEVHAERRAPDRDQHALALHRLVAMPQHHGDTAFDERAPQLLGDFGIEAGKHLLFQLDDRDLRAKRAVEVSELESNRARTNHHDARRHHVEHESLLAGNHAVANLHPGKQ